MTLTLKTPTPRMMAITHTRVQKARHEHGRSKMITFGRSVHATITVTTSCDGTFAVDQTSANPVKLHVAVARLRRENPGCLVRAFIREDSGRTWKEVEV